MKEGFEAEKRVGYQIYKEALKEGLVLRPLGNVLYFNPSLIISEEEMEQAIVKCRNTICQILKP